MGVVVAWERGRRIATLVWGGFLRSEQPFGVIGVMSRIRSAGWSGSWGLSFEKHLYIFCVPHYLPLPLSHPFHHLPAPLPNPPHSHLPIPHPPHHHLLAPTQHLPSILPPSPTALDPLLLNLTQTNSSWPQPEALPHPAEDHQQHLLQHLEFYVQ